MLFNCHQKVTLLAFFLVAAQWVQSVPFNDPQTYLQGANAVGTYLNNNNNGIQRNTAASSNDPTLQTQSLNFNTINDLLKYLLDHLRPYLNNLFPPTTTPPVSPPVTTSPPSTSITPSPPSPPTTTVTPSPPTTTDTPTPPSTTSTPVTPTPPPITSTPVTPTPPPITSTSVTPNPTSTTSVTTSPTATPSTPVTPPSSGRKVVGYVANWAQYRGSNNAACQKYSRTLGTIDPTLYTHLIYAFLTVKSDFTVSTTSDDTNLAAEVQQAKQKNPNVKIQFALGGWTFNSNAGTYQIFSQMVSSAANRATFINSCIAIASQYGLDGMDLDWEYPVQSDRGGSPQDTANLVQLFSDFRTILNGKAFLLSIAAPIGTQTQYYNFPAMVPYLDHINIMAYDLHGSWESQVNYNAPLVAPAGQISISSYYSQNYASQNIPSSKLILGMPLYGVTWTVSATNNGAVPPVGTPGTLGTPGPCTVNGGTLAYFEIADLLAQAGSSAIVDNSNPSNGCSALIGNQWIAYDDATVIQAKMNFMKQNNMGGIMTWSVDQDDSSYDAIKLMVQLLN